MKDNQRLNVVGIRSMHKTEKDPTSLQIKFPFRLSISFGHAVSCGSFELLLSWVITLAAPETKVSIIQQLDMPFEISHHCEHYSKLDLVIQGT
jgi:hypothetical protein